MLVTVNIIVTSYVCSNFIYVLQMRMRHTICMMKKNCHCMHTCVVSVWVSRIWMRHTTYKKLLYIYIATICVYIYIYSVANLNAPNYIYVGTIYIYIYIESQIWMRQTSMNEKQDSYVTNIKGIPRICHIFKRVILYMSDILYMGDTTRMSHV